MLRCFLASLAALVLALPAAAAPPGGRVDYNRDVRPILSDACFHCHGPDAGQRKGRLRLDTAAGATADRGGYAAVAPGKPADSELLRRVTAADESERMPPAHSGKANLTAAQVTTLKRWIDEGAEYAGHWAFVAPQRPAVPTEIRNPKSEIRNEIDAFVVARLRAAGLTQSPEADPVTLLRRVTLDLTGLPPTPAEVDAYLADGRSDRYERLVDRLLASPRYGERMALDWLDAARFADTHGYHIDSARDMTHWREWVIDAFNANLPFDRFTVEQLAGDLLPDATPRQRIASGFHRNHMINFEGGAIPEEYHAAYIVDRVNTTATVWLGLTLGCAQCHDHKYDPFTQKEYYQLYAFFHNVPEKGLDGSKGNAVPVLPLPTPEQERRIEVARAAVRTLEAQGAPAAALTAARKALAALEQQVPTAMVMQDMSKPRDTFVLVRGQYDKKGEKVAAAVPGALPPLPAGARTDRLGLAQWLVDPAHPLTARVTVNRVWQSFFGTGLVRTAEDFGSQGDWPSHPELLDWLAVEFRDSGWDVKRLQRLIVTSATYRQSAAVRPEHLANDPENRLLARAPRLRLPAEAIRDQALAAAGLLHGEVGGRSVSPYQPPGIWEELMAREDGDKFTAQKYRQDHGAALYRRTMYTFWKRTAPPPSLVTLDAPDRETCTVRRPRTNTPLQALVLMNDPTYVEAARKLAERTLAEAGPADADRIAHAVRLVLARPPRPEEATVLQRLLDQQRAKFRADPSAAAKLLAVGESPADARHDRAELAAWTVLATTLFNLDEAVTRG